MRLRGAGTLRGAGVSTNNLLLHLIILKQIGSPSVAMTVRAQTMRSLAETMAVRHQTMKTRV